MTIYRNFEFDHFFDDVVLKMADRRKTKKRKEESSSKPSKLEYVIAKYIRGHLPSKRTTLFSHKVDYFVASKAVNLLLDSPWAKGGSSEETLFTTRESIVEYLDSMLKHNFFHRARKIPLLSKETKGKKKTDDSSDEQDGKKKKKGTKKETDKKKPEEKKKKKFKLDMHLDQIFVDGSEVYVWIYEPTPWKAWIIGSFFVIGAILLCLFPLWPQNVRKGVYYLSIAAAGFLVFILSLAVIRVIVFCIVWAVSMGKHHLWLLPNLTEDVGFLESFWPLYKYECRGQTKKGSEETTTDNKSTEDDKKDEEDDKDNGGTSVEQETPDVGKKKRKKRRKSTESRQDEVENGAAGESVEETKKAAAPKEITDNRSEGADHTDTDRETTEEDDNFEVLNADDVSDSDSSDIRPHKAGS